MIQRNPILDFISHAILVLGVVVVFFPIYVTFIGSTQTAQEISSANPISLLPGTNIVESYRFALFGGKTEAGATVAPALPMMGISLASALIIAIGKIAISLLSAFAIVDAATAGGPGKDTAILVYKVYYDGFKALDLGSSAAQSVVLMVIVVILTVIQFRYVEKKVNY